MQLNFQVKDEKVQFFIIVVVPKQLSVAISLWNNVGQNEHRGGRKEKTGNK